MFWPRNSVDLCNFTLFTLVIYFSVRILAFKNFVRYNGIFYQSGKMLRNVRSSLIVKFIPAFFCIMNKSWFKSSIFITISFTFYFFLNLPCTIYYYITNTNFISYYVNRNFISIDRNIDSIDVLCFTFYVSLMYFYFFHISI